MNIASLLTKAARAHSTRVAISSGAEKLTYEELDKQASQAGSALRAAGLGPGDRVAIWMQNRIEYSTALFGALRAGLVVVPINAKLHPREVAAILEDASADALITDSGDLSIATMVRLPDDWTAFLAAGEEEFEDVDTSPEALAWLFFTSGTSGFPKGAMLSHRNLLAMTMSALADVYSFSSEDVVLHPSPLSHGCGLYLLVSVARGAHNLIYGGSRFEGREVLELVERKRVTSIAFVAPTQIVRLLDVNEGFDCSSLRCIIYGGAPIHRDHARAALRRFGPVLYQVFGQGEAPMTISCLKPTEHTGDMIESAGRPRTNVEVRILDGEIVVRGDVVTSGYWRNPEATAAALVGGWLHTGDLGYIDERGLIFLHDRKGDVIISGGTNIYPREVENVLIQHPGVRDVAVFGAPDREWGERVVAAVVADGSAVISTQDLQSFCKQQLASFKKPSDILFMDMDALPHNAYGKVLRRQLREQYLANASSCRSADPRISSADVAD